MSFSLETPTLADGEALDAMAVESWRETFAHFYKPEDLEAYLGQAHGPDGWLIADLKRAQVRWQVARIRGAIAGYIKLVPPHLEQSGANDTQIGQLYILAQWHGKGIAQALMDWAIAQARASGSPAIILTVFEKNERAIAFYRKYGFVHVGDYDFPVGEQIDRDLVMRLAL